MNPGGKLLLVELVIAPGNAADLGKVIDLEMLVIASGKERTEAEYRQLLAGAGWRLTPRAPDQVADPDHRGRAGVNERRPRKVVSEQQKKPFKEISQCLPSTWTS